MSYDSQDRGGVESYASYFAGMNKSMRQKVALVSAYFPAHGRIADMGSGSGQGSFDLASLYPGLEVVGVDVNPKAVEISRASYRRPNLRFEVGDIAEKLLPEGSLHGILNSSVLHHVTSFNQFSRERVRTLLKNQVAQLAEGGILAIRDFLAPLGTRIAGEVPVEFELPEGDGTAALFERFCREFRCFFYPHGVVPYSRLKARREGFGAFEVEQRMATEFLLRKDYREDWDVEIQEEYLYFDQEEFEEAVAAEGLRILLSRPVWNPWIVQNRFEGRYFWRHSRPLTTPIPHPATNYLIVAEKVRTGRPTRFVERQAQEVESPSFLRIETWNHRPSGALWDLVSRPSPTVDVIPWFMEGGHLHALVRGAYPRPILTVSEGEPPLDFARTQGFLHEPLSFALESQDPSVVTARLERLGLPREAVLKIEQGPSYLPSPGGLGEKVQALWVQVTPEVAKTLPRDLPSVGELPEGGQFRCVEATQTLRAAQVGGMLDARIELNLYALLAKLNLTRGPWIGAELLRTDIPCEPPRALHGSLALPGDSAQGQFTRAGASAGFLKVMRSEFEAYAHLSSDTKASLALEWVMPRARSSRTGIVAPYFWQKGELHLLVETRDLPAAEIFEGRAELWTLPAWRLGEQGWERDRAEAWLREQLRAEFGLEVSHWTPLGGAFCPSAGTTPETVTPYAAAVSNFHPAANPRFFAVRLSELLGRRSELRDGHLLIIASRLGHAGH